MTFDNLLRHRVWPMLWQVFSRLFIMLGLPLLAWGVDDLDGFLAHPVRAAFTTVVLLQAGYHAWLILRLPPAPVHQHPPHLEHWHYSITELLFILAAFGDRREILTWAENMPLRWVGLGIYALGSLYSSWGNHTWANYLRRDPTRFDESPAMISEGPFYWTRYPSLLILFLYALGFALAFRSWAGLVFLLPLIAMLFRRLNEWEALNAKRYGQAWTLRCQMSKRVIPYIF